MTKNIIKQRIFEYMESKYSNPSIQDLLNLCTFLDPRFKFDYIKNDRLHNSTVDLIKDTIQQQIIEKKVGKVKLVNSMITFKEKQNSPASPQERKRLA